MKKSLFFLTLVLGATLLVGSAFADEERGDDGQLVGMSAGSISFGSSGGRPAGSLTTTFAGGNGYAGNMVDIVPNFDMMIDAIDVHVTAVGETAIIDVYWKDGTCVGFETSPADWTFLGSFTGTGAGSLKPTFIDMYGNGKTFLAGQTYGLYVDLQNYATITGNMSYTNGTPTVYSNTDLTLTTWCGMTTPAFNSFFADRMWNGTIYYDDPHVLDPRIIIRANGASAPLTVYDFQDVKIDVQFDAFSAAGLNADLWIVIKSPYGRFSYDSFGPHVGWWRDFAHAYSTGPLGNVMETVCNQTLLPGKYTVYCAVDRVADGLLKLSDVALYSSLEIQVDPFTSTAMTEDFDDGVADDWVDDGAHWSVPLDTYYLDTPSTADYVSYYAGSAYADFTYTVDMYQVDTGNVTLSYDYGIIFRSDGTQANGYELYCESDGSVYLYVRGPSALLYSNTLSTSWITGVGSWNTVSVDVRGDTIDLYINGILETSVINSTHTWGYVGITGQGSGIYDQEYQYDNISVTL